MKTTCPICASENVDRKTVNERFQYKGTTLFAREVEFTVCAGCGEEFVLPEQARRNDVRFADAKRTYDGQLVSTDIVALRKSLRLTQQNASRLFGGGPNAFSKYERGEVIQSAAMDLLMRVARDVPEALEYLREQTNVRRAPPAHHVQLMEEWKGVVESLQSNVIVLEKHRATHRVRGAGCGSDSLIVADDNGDYAPMRVNGNG